MKKSFCLILALLLILSIFVSCGENPDKTDETKEEVTTKTPYAIPEAKEIETQNGVFAKYYSDKTFTTYAKSDTVEQIGGVWEAGTSPIEQVGAENYSIEYIGRMKSPVTGTITFTSNCDDGIVFILDGKELINDAGPHYPETHTATFEAEKDKMYAFKIKYYNGDLGGQCVLQWAYDGQTKCDIPLENLYLPEYPISLTFETNNNTLTVTAEVQEVGTENYTLILVCDEEEVTRASRNYQHTWEASMEANEKEVTAFVVDKEGNRISPIYKKYANEDARVVVDTSQVVSQVEPLLYGACMEDVNHELYGGIWSQMIFGEAFEEDGILAEDNGFTTAGGSWKTETDGDDTILVIEKTDNGPKLVYDNSVCQEGTFSADIYNAGEGVGFILKTSNAKAGADSFNGYEVTVFNNMVRLGKHLYNYTCLKEVNTTAPTNKWINLKVETTEDTIKVYLNSKLVLTYTDENPIESGAFGFRTWNAKGKYKNIEYNGNPVSLARFNGEPVCSGMWRASVSENVVGITSVLKNTADVYSGTQSQRLTFTSGSGAVSINNMGLNRMGLSLQENKDYNGYFYAKSNTDLKVYVAFESEDGTTRYAETSVTVSSADYTKYSFSLTPSTTDLKGRFVIEIQSAGTLDVGYVFLEPGSWGLYKGLHVRKDVGEMLENQGITVLRFGGCQANCTYWKWKEMLGAPEERAPFKGWWYDYASYGFGIIEFMDLCEALGVEYVPDFNSNETAQDIADFIMFATGTDESNEWVQLRISMGRKAPYNLKYIQIGNEEKVDVAFATKFNKLANAIWDVNPNIIPVVGDFDYKDIITDVDNPGNNASGLTNLDGQIKILENAIARDQEVWFDVHIWSEHNQEPISMFNSTISFYDVLKKECPEAQFKLCVFELNAATHDLERAICNALAIVNAERAGGVIKIMCSANALQVDKQNDNGWDQGLLFMDNTGAWLQPCGYVDVMFGSAYLPNVVASSIDTDILGVNFDITTTASKLGDTVCVKIINRTGTDKKIAIQIPSLTGKVNVTFTTMAGEMKDVNTTENKTNIVPVTTQEEMNNLADGYLASVEGYSITVITFTK